VLCGPEALSVEPEDNPPVDTEEPEESPGLAEALQSLPLLEDDMYLRMQGLSLAIVDELLEGLEQQLLSEYIEQESTPIPTAMLVSGTSQLWVFGVYELLRTWRQRARQVLKFADEVSRLTPAQLDARVAEQKERVLRLAANPRLANPAHSRAFERAAKDPGYAARLRSAMERSEIPFRRLEALRVYLAKARDTSDQGVFRHVSGLRPDQHLHWLRVLADRSRQHGGRRAFAP